MTGSPFSRGLRLPIGETEMELSEGMVSCNAATCRSGKVLPLHDAVQGEQHFVTTSR